MIKIMTIFGTRPEAIKMAPLIKELKNNNSIDCKVCITGQHRQMLDQVMHAFNIKADFDLNIMQQGQTLTDITSRVMYGLEEVFAKEKPDMILVHGDTTTAFASALTAFYNNIFIGHVEAGLRTFDKLSPYPEEMNRQMISCLSDLNFAPTKLSSDNLKKEGRKNIILTGNTAIDAMKTTVKKDYYHEIFDWIKDDKMILLTAHRRENLGEPMVNIFKAIRRIVEEEKNIKVVYPVHLNPRVRELANDILSDCDKIKLIEPLDVLAFHNFINKSYIILTDSGGIQEEAPSLGKPVLVLRDTTERPEGIEAGTLKLVGTNENDIYFNVKELLNNRDLYDKMSKSSNPYGDGFASQRIVDAIINYFDTEEH